MLFPKDTYKRPECGKQVYDSVFDNICDIGQVIGYFPKVDLQGTFRVQRSGRAGIAWPGAFVASRDYFAPPGDAGENHGENG